ncbi:MAG: histidine phosphatase family protein [Anaerolineae bacterium]
MAIQRLVFLRPGETDWNKMERWQGTVAVPLNETGRAQAERVAQYIRNTGMNALYTSDLRRAVETAQIIAAAIDLQPVQDARLRERAVGIWQGLTRREIALWYPEEYAQLQADPENYRIPGGESRRDVRERVQSFMADLFAKEQGEVVGILSHTTAMRTLLPELVPDFAADKIKYSNMSVTTLGREGDGPWRIIMLDDTRHLEGLSTMAFGELEDR